MDWTEVDDTNNDRCSTASSVSTRAESVNSNSSPSNGQNNLPTAKPTNKSMNGSTKSMNQDSLSDAELSDFSLNDSDDEEFRSQGNSGEFESQ